uniref:RIIa domain-containing protein n=1 Tax=Trichuris muris TaxID=70415 RepID=A0A5S6QHE7_TRIMR
MPEAGTASDTNNRYPVPEGFRPLLVALAREVLSNQPRDLYAFGALFFHTLMQVRDEAGVDPLLSKHAYGAFQSVLIREACRLGLERSSDRNAQRQDVLHADDIENLATNLTDTLATSNMDKNQSATKIQAGIRGYLTRKHLEQKGIKVHRPVELHMDRARLRSQSLDQRHERVLTPDEAAVMIQASVRSYLTRKHLEAQGVYQPRKHSQI